MTVTFHPGCQSSRVRLSRGRQVTGWPLPLQVLAIGVGLLADVMTPRLAPLIAYFI
jgi:hypothetical protein